MGECTDFFAARRSDLRKGGELAQKAFWAHNLGFLNKAFWFDRMLWEAPKNLNASDEDYDLIKHGLHSDIENPLTVEFLEYVIGKLEELDKRVHSMPCDPEKDKAVYFYNEEKKDFDFDGTPNGIAMMREVEKVLNTRCEFDFEYPWEEKDATYYEPGTTILRRILREVIDEYNALNTDGDWILYKTTG